MPSTNALRFGTIRETNQAIQAAGVKFNRLERGPKGPVEMAQTFLTNVQFKALSARDLWRFTCDHDLSCYDQSMQIASHDGTEPENCPILFLRHRQMSEFAASLGCRLPTKEEWLTAAAELGRISPAEALAKYARRGLKTLVGVTAPGEEPNSLGFYINQCIAREATSTELPASRDNGPMVITMGDSWAQLHEDSRGTFSLENNWHGSSSSQISLRLARNINP
jgi:hypothetical protein